MSRRSLAAPRWGTGPHRRRRRGTGRLREHDHAGGRRRRRAATARASSAIRPRAARSTAPASRSRASDYPVVLPRRGEPVKSSAKPERGGELQIYNYADYLNPAVLKAFGKQEGVSVRVTTFDTLDEAFSKLSTGGLEFDIIFSTPDQLSRLVGRKLIQPLNFELIPNLQKNVWPELHSPFYDVGPRYSVPYTVYTTGIAWRNDLLDFDPSKMDQPWDAFWSPQAEKYRGKVAILDDSREGPGMALMRRGVTDLNTEDPDLLAQAGADLKDLEQARRRQGLDRRLRDRPGRARAPAPGLVGRHDRRRHLLHAQGRQARRALLLVPEAGRPDLQRLHLRGGQGDQAGHRAPLPELHARQQGQPTRTSRATSATRRR